MVRDKAASCQLQVSCPPELPTSEQLSGNISTPSNIKVTICPLEQSTFPQIGNLGTSKNLQMGTK